MGSTGGGASQTAQRSFPPYSYSPRDSREFVRKMLALWHCEDLTPTAELLACELVTNVVMHAMTNVSMDISWDAPSLRVAISDGSTVVPAMRDIADTTGGFGLRIVDAIATAWGIAHTDTGKAVWFTLTREPSRP